MVIAAELTFDNKQLNSLMTKLEKNLPEEMEKSLFGFAQTISTGLKANALQDPLRPITSDRRMAVARIKAKKLTQGKSIITMPKSLSYLDGMRPHFVSLKGNPSLVSWAKKHYGNATITGRSTAHPNFQTQRGRTTKGAIYVTPHPFIQKTLHDSRKHLPNQLRKGITKAFGKNN